MNYKRLLPLVLAIAFPGCFAYGGQADNQDRAGRGNDRSKVDYLARRAFENSPWYETLVNYPEDADKSAQSLKQSILGKHHKCKLKKVGPVFSITDEKTKQTVLIKPLWSTPAKSASPALLALVDVERSSANTRMTVENQENSADIRQQKNYQVIKSGAKIAPTDQTVEERQTNFLPQAKDLADSIKQNILDQHHNFTFSHSGQIYTVVDEKTHHKTIVKSLRSTAKTDSWGGEALAELYPRSPIVLAHLAQIYEAQRDWSKACDFYRRSLALPDTKADQLVDKANRPAEKSQLIDHYAYCEIMQTHYEAAIKLASQAVEVNPGDISAYTNRAKLYQKLQKPDLAAKDQQKARVLSIQIKAATVASIRNSLRGKAKQRSALLGDIANRGFFEKVVWQANQMIKDNHSDGLAYLARARALVKIGQYTKALSDYKTLLATTKDAASIKEEMAVALRLSQHGAPPYGDLSLLKDSPPRIDYDAGTGKKVLRSLSEVAAQHKGDYRVYEGIGNALKKRSLSKSLDAELTKMLLIDPGDAGIILAKLQTAEALHNWPEAEKMCSAYIKLFGDNADGFNVENLQEALTVRALARKALNNLAGASADQSILLQLGPAQGR